MSGGHASPPLYFNMDPKMADGIGKIVLEKDHTKKVHFYRPTWLLLVRASSLFQMGFEVYFLGFELIYFAHSLRTKNAQV